MIVAFSTSSPVASLALFDPEGRLAFWDARPAGGRASEACLAMLAASEVDPSAVELWLADLGPGSFTGTRVGVVMAKTFAWTFGRQVGGLASFDLIDPNEVVAIPNRKHEWLVRVPGEAPRLVPAGEITGVGYAPGLSEETYPDAARFAPWILTIDRVIPEALVPGYVVPPSISMPKRPLPTVTVA